MEHIAAVTRSLMEHRRFRPGRAFGAFWAWPDIVGADLAGRTEVERLEGACLYVRVASAPWAEELFLMKPILLRSLREHLGPGAVKDIRFRVGVLSSRRRRPRADGEERHFPPLSAPSPAPTSEMPPGELGDALRHAYQIARERGRAPSSSMSGKTSPSAPKTSS